MKKMRGIVDPLTLGFIIMIFGTGIAATTNTSNDMDDGIAKSYLEESVAVNEKLAQSE